VRNSTEALLRIPDFRAAPAVAALLSIVLENPCSVGAQIPGNAEPSSAESPNGEIIVTARRREERAQDVPIPISVVSGNALEASGQFRVEQLNQVLPSTNIQYNGPRQTSFALRGLGNNPANDALESSMAIYLDNVYLGRASMANLDLTDIDQIALLRGSQGALFGKNTTAGVLSIATRPPSFVPEGSVEASFGDFDSSHIRAIWSQPLVDDQLATRMSVSRSSQDGFVFDTTTGRKLNGYERLGARGQLLWTPAENVSVRFIGDYSEEHSDAGAFVLYSAGPNGGAKYYAAVAAAGASVVYSPDYDVVTLDSRQHFDVSQTGASIEANWLVGGYKLTSISAYRTWRFVPTSDSDYTNLSAIPAAGQQVDDNQWTEELRLASPSYRGLSYVAGLFFLNQHQNNLLFTQYGTDAQAITALQLGNASYVNADTQTAQFLNTHSTSAFGQATFKASDSWEYSVGLRETSEDKNVSLNRSSTGQPGFVSNPNFVAYNSGELTRSDNTGSGLLSASYRFSDPLLAYASFTRGAKSGGINPSVPVPGLSVQSLYFRPEWTDDAEVGLKSTLLNGRLTFNTNLFWVHVQDYQATLLLQPLGGNSFQQILSNIGNVRTEGVETEANGLFGDLTVRLAASFNDAIYLTYHDAPCSAEELAPNLAPGQKICDLSGQPLVGAPRWIVNPGTLYSHRAFDDVKWTAQVDFAWRSKFFGSTDDSQFAQVPSYGLLNLRWGLHSSDARPWAVSLWSNNVCDKRYVLGGLSVASRLYNYIATPGQPRTWGATIQVNF
jgi:iron complex outermembrane receptor protein